jgi:hypothetical protein
MDLNLRNSRDEQPLPGELHELFRSYRDSFAETEGSTNFMPGLWARIDGQRRVTYSFGRLASAFVTAAFLLCLIMSGTLLTMTQSLLSSPATYVDVLDANSADEIEVLLASAER